MIGAIFYDNFWTLRSRLGIAGAKIVNCFGLGK